MKLRKISLAAAIAVGMALSTTIFAWFPQTGAEDESASTTPATRQPGTVNCANLIYADNKTSTCFSPEFLAQIGRETNIVANPRLVPVRMEASELFNFPFAVMTGEGKWTLTESQRENMRNYLQAGGFIIASAGCSSSPWQDSFRREIAKVFPDARLSKIDMSHPAFHTVYEITQLQCKRASATHLEGLEIDGKIVLVFSPDGLNDTGKVGGNCCCCGGDEVQNARQVNVNLLAYALTH